jgi:hypothetical protein
MANSRENKLRMYYAVSAVCECNHEVWQDNEVFVADYKRFASKIPKIELCQDQLKIENIFTETFKSFDRVELEELAYYLSGKIKLLAKEMNNLSLMTEVQTNRDNIGNCENMELISICNNLAKHASVHLDQLISHDITIESIADLQQLTSAYFLNMNRTKVYNAKNKSLDDQLRKLYRDVDDIFRSKLDYDIEFYKNSNIQFYDQYKAARIVIDIEESPVLSYSVNLVSAIDD